MIILSRVEENCKVKSTSSSQKNFEFSRWWFRGQKFHQWKEKDRLILPILGFTMFPSTGMEIIDVEHNSQDIFFKNSKIPIFFSFNC